MMWQIRVGCCAILVSFILPSYAAIQRWVDERGVVHYGDHIPPEYLGKGSIQLNNQGVRVKEKNRLLTDTERQQEQLVQEQQVHIEREREEQNRRDRSLLDTYANVEEIARARTRALESIDNAMNVTTVRLVELTKQKTILDIKLQKASSHSQFAKLSTEKVTNSNEIEHLNDILTKRRQEKLQTEQRYSADLQRYNEITMAVAAKRKLPSKVKESIASPLILPSSVTPSVVPPLQRGE